MLKPTPTILFVDDEPNILSSLQRLLHDEDWNLLFASSGEEALELLERQHVDLIVSDVRMPGLDGIGLFCRVKQLYPWMVRIFLTGYGEKKSVTKALAEGCTQQILPKPWVDQELKEVIRSALRQSLQQREKSAPLQSLINSIPLLPPLPDSYTEIQNCFANRDEISIERVAEIIGQDVALSTALLHWANSALFGQRYLVTTVKKAIVVLGTDIVEGLILSSAINQAIGSGTKPVKGFDPQAFQGHSMGCAVIARLLLHPAPANDPEKSDRAFIAGLLHDLGILAEARFFPEQFARVIELATEKQVLLGEAEREVLGTCHHEIGGFLAEWWALPRFIVNTVRWHHQPRQCPIDPDIMGAVHVANGLAHHFGIATCGDYQPPTIDNACGDRFFLCEERLAILQAETEQILQGTG